jgi:hypothetical protein
MELICPCSSAQNNGLHFFSARSLAGPDILRPTNTDNLMQDLQTERFLKPVMINGMHAAGDGAIKTFPCAASRIRRPHDRGGHGDAGGGSILRRRAFRHVDVDVAVVKH